MTDAEKKMKKYTTAIERRLHMPRDIRARVMSDFISAVEARREAGMSDEEIYQEFGTPKQASSELSEQMKEYTYRKSPWRILFLLAAVAGAWELFGFVLSWVLYLSIPDPHFKLQETASLGIIGGADGPTAIFVTTAIEPWWNALLPIALLLIGIWGFLRLRKCKRK